MAVPPQEITIPGQEVYLDQPGLRPASISYFPPRSPTPAESPIRAATSGRTSSRKPRTGLEAQGDLEGAGEQIGRALAIRERVYGPDHHLTVKSRRNLAAHRGCQGRSRGLPRARLRDP